MDINWWQFIFAVLAFIGGIYFNHRLEDKRLENRLKEDARIRKLEANQNVLGNASSALYQIRLLERKVSSGFKESLIMEQRDKTFNSWAVFSESIMKLRHYIENEVMNSLNEFQEAFLTMMELSNRVPLDAKAFNVLDDKANESLLQISQSLRDDFGL